MSINIKTSPLIAAALVGLVFYALSCIYASPRDLAPVAAAVSNSVYITQGDAGGSGTLFVRTNSAGDQLVLVVTAGHVLAAGDGSNHWNVSISPAGAFPYSVPAVPLLIHYKVPVDVGILLLLGPVQTNLTGATAFLNVAPPPGTEIFSVSAPYGERHAQSVDFCTLAHNFRTVYATVMFQFSCAIFPGSSGGGVFTTDGRWLGSIACMRAPGVVFATPARLYHSFLTTKCLEWVLDPSRPVPSKLQVMLDSIK